VFTVLGKKSLTGREIAKACRWHPRGVFDLLDGLVSLGLLDRDGNGAEAPYRNTAETATYLDKTSADYVGGMLEMANARLYKYWDGLGEAMRTGEPQTEIKHSGESIFALLYRDPDKLRQFMNAMTGLSAMNFRALAEKFDFSRYATLCDVGGATGQLSIAIAKRHPRIRCTSFDLPAVEPIAKETIAAAGLSDRIATAHGDFFADPFPKADVIRMGMILHDWNLERKMSLIRSAHAALPSGGAFIVVESLIDDARRKNVMGLMMSLNMLIEFGEAFDYTAADFQGWCRKVGFKKFEVLPLAGPSSAAIAYK
jgi:tRNA A58 N-methylase Trm61